MFNLVDYILSCFIHLDNYDSHSTETIYPYVSNLNDVPSAIAIPGRGLVTVQQPWQNVPRRQRTGCTTLPSSAYPEPRKRRVLPESASRASSTGSCARRLTTTTPITYLCWARVTLLGVSSTMITSSTGAMRRRPMTGLTTGSTSSSRRSLLTTRHFSHSALARLSHTTSGVRSQNCNPQRNWHTSARISLVILYYNDLGIHSNNKPWIMLYYILNIMFS